MGPLTKLSFVLLGRHHLFVGTIYLTRRPHGSPEQVTGGFDDTFFTLLGLVECTNNLRGELRSWITLTHRRSVEAHE
jgi:hypothetical protein